MFEIEQQVEDYCLYLSNCISQEDIDYILGLSKSELLQKGSSRLGSHVVIANEETESYEALAISNKIFAKIYPVMVKSMEVYATHFGLNIDDYVMSDPTFWIKTWDLGAEIGHHSDSWESDGETLVPSVSIVLYLSSDFEGGELVFVDKRGVWQDDKDIYIKPSSGHVAVFDSNVVHAVKKVIGGNRISTDITYMHKFPTHKAQI